MASSLQSPQSNGGARCAQTASYTEHCDKCYTGWTLASISVPGEQQACSLEPPRKGRKEGRTKSIINTTIIEYIGQSIK